MPEPLVAIASRKPHLSRWLVLAMLAAWLPGASGDIHVSVAGDDGWAGTESRPFRTLERARDEVRALRVRGAIPATGLSIWIGGGDHVRDRALELGPQDSGSAEAPLRWRVRGGGQVRLLGGRVLRDFVVVTNAGVLGRLPEAARGRVVEADLGALGITTGALGDLRSRGFGRATTPSHAEFFHGGKPMTLARWPNDGEHTVIAGVPESTSKGDEHGGRLGGLEAGFHYEGDRPRGWREPTEAWVHGYWAWDWANSYERIASVDLERRLLVTAAPHGLYGFRKGQRIHFLNILEELDQPGEWYVDRSACKLYFWPPGEAASWPESLLSLLDQPLIRMQDASGISIEGLIFEAVRANAIEIRGGTGNRVAGCVVRNVGNHGVVIEGGRGHTVVGCNIHDTGDGGVVLTGGDRRTLTAGEHAVENTEFARQGRWSKCYVPAVLMTGVGLRVSNCLIRDHPHCGILYGGNDHRIEFNEIRRVALETGDVGAIYAGRDYTFRGNVIRHNFIHHTGGVGMGSMGVYMDDCVSGTEIRGNIFHKVQRAAFLGGGRDHAVVNNVFVDCNHAVELDGRGLDTSPVWRRMVDETMRNRLRDVPLELYRQRYPGLRDLDAFYGPPDGMALRGEAFRGVPPGGNLVARNVCVGKWLNVTWHAQQEHLHLDSNWVGADPLFAGRIDDASTASAFALRRESPAWATGFEAIPVERIGLQPDAWRGALAEEVR